MGIKLKNLIETSNMRIKDMKGTVVAIDGSNMLFQILYNPAQKEKNLENRFYIDSSQRVITHLYGWLYKIINFYNAQIFPIIVFDHVRDPLKHEFTYDIQQKWSTCTNALRKLLNQGELERAKQIGLSKDFLWPNCVYESQRVLTNCGIPVIMAPGEAEAECVRLQQKSIVDYVVTTDFDVICYGAKNVIRQITFQSKKMINNKTISYRPELNIFDAQENLKKLGLNLFEIIDLSIILGNDYYPGISKLGPQKALESIKFHHSLENVRKKHPDLFIDLSVDRIHQIRKRFLDPIVTNIEKIEIPSLNILQLKKFLLEDHHLDPVRIESILEKLVQSFSKYHKQEHLNGNSRFQLPISIEDITKFTAADKSSTSNIYSNNQIEKKRALKKPPKIGAFINLDDLFEENEKNNQK